MVLDTKLILEALNKRFDAWEVRFDNFLNSGSKVSTAPASSSSPSKQDAAQVASKAVIADNWGGLFDGGDDLEAAVYNTASAESVGLHDFPCNDHDLAPPRPVNLDAATTTASHEAVSTNFSSEYTATLCSVATTSAAAAPSQLGATSVGATTPSRFGAAASTASTPSLFSGASTGFTLGLSASCPTPATASAPDLGFGGATGSSLSLFGITNTTPAKCSSMGRSHDDRILAPVTTALAPSSTSPLEESAWVAAPAPSLPTTVAVLPSALARAVLSAEEIPTEAPTKCSTNRLCSGADEVIPKQVKTLSEMECKPSSTGMDTEVVFEGMQQRYITNPACAHFMEVLLLDSVTNGHNYQKVSKSMLSQPELLFASVVDIGPWPPPLKNKETLLSATIKLDFNLAMSFGSGQEVANPRPPWPPPTRWVLSTSARRKSSPGQSFIGGWVNEQLRQPGPSPMQFEVLPDSVQLRPQPWPSFTWQPVVQSVQLWLSFDYFTVALQLENFLLLIGVSVEILVYPEFLHGWHISGCSASSSCQVSAFTWSPSLHLNLKLRVSQHPLQVILVIYALGFRFWFTCCTLKIYSNVSVQWKLSCVSLMCLYMSGCSGVRSTSSQHKGMVNLIRWRKAKLAPPTICSSCEAIINGIADNYKLDPSKGATRWLPECYDWGAANVSDYLVLLQSLSKMDGQISINMELLVRVALQISVRLVTCELVQLLNGSGSYMSGVLFHFSSTCPWTKVQVTDKLYSSPIAEILVKLQEPMLPASFLKIKTKYGINIKYLQVPWEPS